MNRKDREGERGLDLHRGETCCVVSPADEALEALAYAACGSPSPIIFRLDGSARGPRERASLATAAWVGARLFGDLTGAEQLFLDPGPDGKRFGILKKAKILGDGAAFLARFGLKLDLSARVSTLNANERTLIALAAAVLSRRPLLICWRLARHLTLAQFEALTAVLGECKRAGRGVLYFPDRVEEIGLVADRLYVLQEGAVSPVEDFRKIPPGELSRVLKPREGLNILSLYDPIHRARKIMLEQCEAATLHFEGLAESVGLSYDFFRKEFRRKTGVSPKQYLLGLKLERAKELLLYTNDLVEEIAGRLGFNDGSHFAKFFRGKEGVGPIEFRGQRQSRFEP